MNLSKRIAAWWEIQRQRIAHAIYPDAFPAGWTPRTVAEAVADHERWLEMEALNREHAALGLRMGEIVIPTIRESPDPVEIARTIKRRYGD